MITNYTTKGKGEKYEIQRINYVNGIPFVGWFCGVSLR